MHCLRPRFSGDTIIFHPPPDSLATVSPAKFHPPTKTSPQSDNPLEPHILRTDSIFQEELIEAHTMAEPSESLVVLYY